jgi:hypothetical protein
LLPVEVGFLSATAEVMAVDVSNQLAAIGDNDLRIIDVADPAMPLEIGYYQQGWISDLTIDGNYAYLVDGELTIVDISDPANPVWTGNYAPYPALISHVAVRDNYAFVSQNGCDDVPGEICTAGFFTLDLSDPATPIRQGDFHFFSHDTHDVSLAGDYAYIAADVGGVQVANISQPAAPGWAGYYSRASGGGNMQIISNQYLFAGAGFQVWNYESYVWNNIFDITDPHLPVERAYLDGGQLRLADGYAYIIRGSRHSSSLHALDITDPLNPVETGGWGPYQGFVTNILIGESYIYANGDYQTVALEKSSLAQVATTTPPITVVYNGNGYVYGDRGSDLHIYTPTLEEVNVVEDLHINRLQVIGRYGYATNGNLLILDMINPAEPVVVGSFELPGYEMGYIQISGDYAYIPTDSYGVLIVDISNPAAPVQVGSYATPDFTYILVVGNYLYVQDGANGIVVLDVSNPAAPVQVASYPKPDPNEMFIDGTYLYAAYDGAGIYIFKLYGLDRQFYLPLATQE